MILEKLKKGGLTYDLTKEDDVLATDDKDATGDVSIGVGNVYPLNRILEHQVGYFVEVAITTGVWKLVHSPVCSPVQRLLSFRIVYMKVRLLPNWSKDRRIPISFLPSLSTTRSFSR